MPVFGSPFSGLANNRKLTKGLDWTAKFERAERFLERKKGMAVAKAMPKAKKSAA